MNLQVTGNRIDEAQVVGQASPATCREADEPVRAHDHVSSATRPASASSLGVRAGRRRPRPNRAGQLVADRYRILHLLGEGGMGAVWLALDCVLSRPVALKELKAPEPDEAGHHMAALREARAASVVTHPGVVQVYNCLVDEDQAWIVMEALSGTTLAKAIRLDGPLSVERVVAVGLGLLEALEAIHGGGVIHGDLKPGNVHMTGTGRPVLTDFGLASIGEDAADAEPAQFAGSPPYMAPEVIRTGTRTRASDLFALGAILYEAAEGRRPFDDDTPTATLLSVLHHDPAPALPGTLVGKVIDALLTKDPRRRLSAHSAYALLKQAECEVTRTTAGAVRAVAPGRRRSGHSDSRCGVRGAVSVAA